VLLAINVGNTNTSIGVFENKMLGSWRICTYKEKTADEYELIISQFLCQGGIGAKEITGIIISSVVPPVLIQLREMSIRGFNIEPVIVSSDLELGMTIQYDNPKELGADRIVNAVGGYAIYGGPLIVVDFGTATNFDVVSEEGVYFGGAIAPGIGISMEALWDRTALLPKIDLSISRGEAIGRNTISCMQSGCYFGFLGLMEEIIRRIKHELPKEPKVIATGGLAELIAGNSKLVDSIDPDLTLKGLQIIFDRVCS